MKPKIYLLRSYVLYLFVSHHIHFNTLISRIQQLNPVVRFYSIEKTLGCFEQGAEAGLKDTILNERVLPRGNAALFDIFLSDTSAGDCG